MMTRCPVCGMNVDLSTAPQAEYKGNTYSFCSEGCKTEFERNPERFTTRAAGGR